MSVAVVYSRAKSSLAPLVSVETHISRGLPQFSIVGLPETVVKESKDRVRSAIINAGFEFPAKRITINLAPADLPKEGGRFDLPIALSVLAATEQVPVEALQGAEFAGELALSGILRPIQATLPFAYATKQAKRTLFIPDENKHEASLVSALSLYPVHDLKSLCAHLKGDIKLRPFQHNIPNTAQSLLHDLADVKGQHHVKRALEIAAAGGHNLIMVGPPGSGKTMLANCLPGLLPDLDEQASLEVASLASLSLGFFSPAEWGKRPFRHPHHSCSAAALVGGGKQIRPGEITLAHHGVLFLDELPEFHRHVLEVLREPLESGTVTISRAQHKEIFPAQFQLIAAMNPCPCGFLGDTRRECVCTPPQIQRYQSKISGPLLDRIDMHVTVGALKPEDLAFAEPEKGPATADIKSNVLATQKTQLERQGCLNSKLHAKTLSQICYLESAADQLFVKIIQKMDLSARSAHRLLKVARTIADLSGSDRIEPLHLSEAVSFRQISVGRR